MQAFPTNNSWGSWSSNHIPQHLLDSRIPLGASFGKYQVDMRPVAVNRARITPNRNCTPPSHTGIQLSSTYKKYVWVSILTRIHTRTCMCKGALVCGYVYRSQRPFGGVCSSEAIHLGLWVQGLSLAWRMMVGLDWLAREFQGPVCECWYYLLSAGITRVCLCLVFLVLFPNKQINKLNTGSRNLTQIFMVAWQVSFS